MATLKTIAPAAWTVEERAEQTPVSLWQRYTAYADGQAANRTLWFFITLLVHGVLILALPAVLVYYYNASVAVVAVTLICFFANLIANMGGAGIRVTLGFFFASILINTLMALVVIL